MKLKIGQNIELKIFAEEYYSSSYLEVEKGEMYNFRAAERPKWTDLWIRCTADGFFNPILLNAYKRVRNAKCFVLCGTISQNEEDHFAIGKEGKILIPKEGQLHFFANDHRNCRYYKNNRGFINLYVDRIN